MHGTTIAPYTSGVRETAFRHAVEKAGGIERLLATGFLQISYDPSVLAENVPAIMEGFSRMVCNDAHQELFAADIFGTDEVDWKHDSGLYRRNVREQKWFFHCFRDTLDRMKDRDAPVMDYAAFFMAMENLTRRAMHHAVILSNMYDEYHAAKGRMLPYSLTRSFEHGFCLTRALLYLAREQGKPDATAHFDRDGWTTHWFANRQGLIVRDRAGNKHRIKETEYDSICLFPGKKFGGITDYEYGIGTLHGVIDTARESGAEGDRFGLVSFAHPKLNKAEAARILAKDPECESIESSYVL